jgi:hypothetical protein
MSLITDELVRAVRTAVPCRRRASARRAENVLLSYCFCCMAVRAVLRVFVCVAHPGWLGRPAHIPGIVTRPVGSANAVDADDSDADGFWVVEEVTQAQNDSAESDALSDWTDDNGSESSHAIITPIEEMSVARVELYDSRATQHISPYKDDFVTYSSLPTPVLLNAANKQRFPAIGTGTLCIHILNEDLVSELILDNVLHAPAVSYTLVSLGTLDDLGYHAALGGGCLDLHSPDGTWIGRIQKSPRHLYCVAHSHDSAHAVELLTVMELHRCLGHISAASARHLSHFFLPTVRYDGTGLLLTDTYHISLTRYYDEA